MPAKKKQTKKTEPEVQPPPTEDEEYDSDETIASQPEEEPEELLEEDEVDPIVKEAVELVQEPTKPKRGRPKGATNKVQVIKAIKIPKERVKKPKPVVYIIENDDGSLEQIPETNVIEDSKLTKKQTKAIQARELKEETESRIGKSVKVTKKGTVDNRCVKPRSEAQIAATARLVENNRLRRLKQTELKKQKTEELIKGSVEKVIKDKLSDKTEVVKPVKKPAKKQVDYSSDFC